MNKNSETITLLCSQLAQVDGVQPLTPSEWSNLSLTLQDRSLQPEAMLGFSKYEFVNELNLPHEIADRIQRLFERSISLSFELSKLEDQGIGVVTRADREYPSQLKKKLHNNCPPLFYYSGDLSILNYLSVGYVGSRSVSEDDEEFTEKTVTKTINNSYAVVSGGAKGVDSVSSSSALMQGGFAVEFLASAMTKKLKDCETVKYIRDGRLLLLSAVSPSAGFNVGVAMGRNKYIYAQSEGTVVVKSDKNKGGTWAGATENLKYGWCTTFCRDCEYPGNVELIHMGAIGIDENWSGNLEGVAESFGHSAGAAKQLTLF